MTGIVKTELVKKNSAAQAGTKLFLTKPLGIGVLTTAEKKSKLLAEHQGLATEVMCQLNKPGADFAEVAGVTAMTDVTGFGLLGHLSEMCQGSESAGNRMVRMRAETAGCRTLYQRRLRARRYRA